jgi:hypothetical protein
MSKRFRRSAAFVVNPRACSTQWDRNKLVRILWRVKTLERETKAKGRRNGAFSDPGLKVLEALIFKFTPKGAGLCCPSYDALQRATGLSRQGVASGIARLEACGLLRVTRRLVRSIVDGVRQVRQASNVYRIEEPDEGAVTAFAPPPSARARSFPEKGLPLFAFINSLRPSLRDRRDSIPKENKGFSGGLWAAGCAS